MVTIVFSLLSCKFWFCLRPNGETEKQKKNGEKKIFVTWGSKYGQKRKTTISN